MSMEHVVLITHVNVKTSGRDWTAIHPVSTGKYSYAYCRSRVPSYAAQLYNICMVINIHLMMTRMMSKHVVVHVMQLNRYNKMTICSLTSVCEPACVHGTCDPDTHTCSCEDKWEGPDCNTPGECMQKDRRIYTVIIVLLQIMSPLFLCISL